MKPIIEQYVQALIELLESGAKPKEILEGLSRTLSTRGHEKIHRSILSELQSRLAHRSREQVAEVVLAENAHASTLSKAIQEALEALNADKHEVVIDPSIIGGFTATHRGFHIDQSYKSSLIRLYRQIVSRTD